MSTSRKSAVLILSRKYRPRRLQCLWLLLLTTSFLGLGESIRPWSIDSSIAQEAESFTPETPAIEPPKEANPPLNTICQTAQPGKKTELAQFVSQVTSTATMIEQPARGMGAIAEQVAPQIMAYLNSSPFPTIHAAARQAKVPVMMYHDILAEKQVFFDVTPEEFEDHLKLIKQKGLTPISMDQLTNHLRTGLPLPTKPILLTFDDGYEGHYTYVYPLLKKYNYPAVFSIYTAKVGKKLGRSSLNWEQLREMAADPLVTIASHSVSHKVMEGLSPEELLVETQESKRILEAELGIPIRYFTYPEGKFDQAAWNAVKQAGYSAAFTMNDLDERLAGQSDNLLAIGRIGQSRIHEMVDVAWEGPPQRVASFGFDFTSPIRRIDAAIDNVPFVFIAGGRPITVHHHTRAQVPDIIAKTPAIAAVDGGFFNLELLDSNYMLGPVYSQSTGQFVPGKRGEIPFLEGRPLVLIGSDAVKFVPFKHKQHNSLEAIQAEMSDVTDAFIAAGWLVDNGQPQPLERFGRLYDANEPRHRAFWGINQQGQPQIGVSVEPIGSVDLGIALAKAGFRDAVMLDSGASTSLAYKGESLVGYTPRPVPHVVGLVPAPGDAGSNCAISAASR
ncbi:MAG: polysaccharide deacetylase family protein [Leptolyngbyaceae cyanobacterium bins.302]|nr:polysaccharide deacetylase family protein [Leptolyngbyaceae cyanobacterium bins.302]